MLEPGPQGVAHGPPGGTPPRVGLQERRLPEGVALGPLGRHRRAGALVGYWMCIPLIARAMTSRWISEVPSKIV